MSERASISTLRKTETFRFNGHPKEPAITVQANAQQIDAGLQANHDHYKTTMQATNAGRFLFLASHGSNGYADKRRTPTNRINAQVSLGSQLHQLPQASFAHTAPLMMPTVSNRKPTSDRAIAEAVELFRAAEGHRLQIQLSRCGSALQSSATKSSTADGAAA